MHQSMIADQHLQQLPGVQPIRLGPPRPPIHFDAGRLEVLRRVEATGAYANLLLDARLRVCGLQAQDRALATELTYGVLRWQGRLDWILAEVLDRPILALDPPVRQVLRLGAYQLRFLSRIPGFAAVEPGARDSRSCIPGSRGMD